MVDFSDKMSGYSQKQLQILVIMAHPADTFDHCGGTLLHHIRKGDKVTVVSVLQGVRIHDAVVSDQLRYQGGGQKPAGLRGDGSRGFCRERRESGKDGQSVWRAAKYGAGGNFSTDARVDFKNSR